MKKLGIFGGRFDPIHIGHLILARDVLEEFDLDEILFLVSYNPPHKGTVASFEDRFEMVKLAIEGESRFRALDIEKKLGLEKSYTALVLKALRDQFQDARFYFILGEDQFRDFPNWHRPDEVLKLTDLIVLKREGVVDKADDPRIHFYKGRIVSVSSTEIRERVRKGLSVRFLLPERVLDLIEKRRLYGSPDE